MSNVKYPLWLWFYILPRLEDFYPLLCHSSDIWKSSNSCLKNQRKRKWQNVEIEKLKEKKRPRNLEIVKKYRWEEIQAEEKNCMKTRSRTLFLLFRQKLWTKSHSKFRKRKKKILWNEMEEGTGNKTIMGTETWRAFFKSSRVDFHKRKIVKSANCPNHHANNNRVSFENLQTSTDDDSCYWKGAIWVMFKKRSRKQFW